MAHLAAERDQLAAQVSSLKMENHMLSDERHVSESLIAQLKAEVAQAEAVHQVAMGELREQVRFRTITCF